jgi:SAM-dependent methyltransferase
MTKIQLGSGYKNKTGYINIDADPNCKPDILLNIDDVNLLLPFDDSSVDEILAVHVLEHIGTGFFKLLQECYRVLKPGGIFDISVPYPRHDIAIIDPTHVRFILPETFRLFSKKRNQHDIEMGGSASTLALQYNVDFEIVSYDFVHDSFYDSIIPTLSQEMAQRLFREALNTTLESHIVLMAIK